MNNFYIDPFRYNFTDIQNSTFLIGNVSKILETRVVGNLVRYLEFQGYTYIKKDFEGFSKNALNQIYESKRLFFAEKESVISNFRALENNSSSRTKSAQIEQTSSNESSTDFRTLDLQSNSPGLLAVGFEYNWCTDNEAVIAKIRFSSTTQYDLACITSPDGQIYVSPFNKYGFSESYRIDNNYIILNGLNNVTSLPSEYSNMDFRLSYFFGDFNGDGKDEIGLSHTTSQNFSGGIRIYNQESPGIWISRTSPHKKDFCVAARLVCSIQECGVRTGDFNGDGKDDLWCHNKYTGVNEVIFNNANALSYSWYVPDNFSLNHRSWCKEGYLQISDFDGDGKSDAICLDSNNNVSVLYSLGDGSFISKTGFANGNLNLGLKLQGWSFDLQSNITFFRQPNFVVADFDADGYSDLWGISENSDITFDSGINRFLFGNPLNSLASRTTDISGVTVFKQDLFSWCTSGIIFSADFNGDNKDDLFCNANDNNYFRVSFVNSPNVETDSLQLRVTVSNYTFGAFSVSQDQFTNSVQDVNCNNKVRPDDKLGCQAAVSNKIQNIKSITLETQWSRPNTFAYKQPAIEILYLGDGNVSYTPDNSDTKTQKIYINYANGVDMYNNTIQSSLSTLVKSGEGIKLSMATTYVSNALIPYNATASLTAYAGNQALTGNELLSIGRNVLINFRSDLVSAGNEIPFSVSGYIKADIMFGTNNVAVNSNNFYIPTFTRTAATVPSFTVPTPELSFITSEPKLNFTTIASPVIATTPTVENTPIASNQSLYALGTVLANLPCNPIPLSFECNSEGNFYVFPIALIPYFNMQANFRVCDDIIFNQVNNSALGYSSVTLVPTPFIKECSALTFVNYADSSYPSSNYESYSNDTGAQIFAVSFTVNGLLFPPNNTEAICTSFMGSTTQDNNAQLEQGMLEDTTSFNGGAFYVIELEPDATGASMVMYENTTGIFTILSDYDIGKTDRQNFIIPMDNVCQQVSCIGVSFNNNNIEIPALTCST